MLAALTTTWRVGLAGLWLASCAASRVQVPADDTRCAAIELRADPCAEVRANLAPASLPTRLSSVRIEVNQSSSMPGLALPFEQVARRLFERAGFEIASGPADLQLRVTARSEPIQVVAWLPCEPGPKRPCQLSQGYLAAATAGMVEITADQRPIARLQFAGRVEHPPARPDRSPIEGLANPVGAPLLEALDDSRFAGLLAEQIARLAGTDRLLEALLDPLPIVARGTRWALERCGLPRSDKARALLPRLVAGLAVTGSETYDTLRWALARIEPDRRSDPSVQPAAPDPPNSESAPPDSAEIARLAAALDSDDPEQRAAAVLAAIRAGLAGLLVAPLEDPHPLVRSLAAAGLGQIGDPRDPHDLLQAAQTGSTPEAIGQALRVLSTSDRSCARLALRRLLAAGRAEQRRLAAQVLATSRARADWLALVQALEDPLPEVRAQALAALRSATGQALDEAHTFLVWICTAAEQD